MAVGNSSGRFVVKFFDAQLFAARPALEFTSDVCGFAFAADPVSQFFDRQIPLSAAPLSRVYTRNLSGLKSCNNSARIFVSATPRVA